MPSCLYNETGVVVHEWVTLDKEWAHLPHSLVNSGVNNLDGEIRTLATMITTHWLRFLFPSLATSRTYKA